MFLEILLTILKVFFLLKMFSLVLRVLQMLSMREDENRQVGSILLLFTITLHVSKSCLGVKYSVARILTTNAILG
jgi:hypothetical protein